MPAKKKRKATKKQLAALKRGRAIRRKNLGLSKVLSLIFLFIQLMFTE